MFKNESAIFDTLTDETFAALSLEVFRFQYLNNPVYRQWTDLLKINPAGVNTVEQIPFLPIELFKI